MKNFGEIEILSSICNPSTIMDGRGGIFTWIPKDKIKEFNLLYFLPSKVRGNHYHPEFIEYFLVASGSGVMMTKDPKDGSKLVLQMSEGACVRIPMHVSHAFQAINKTTCISFLTKPWDECNSPIIFEDLTPLDKEHEQFLRDAKKNEE